MYPKQAKYGLFREKASVVCGKGQHHREIDPQGDGRHLPAPVQRIPGPVADLTRPRQVGKTTMLQKLAEEENTGREYVTLDDLTEREMAKNDPKMFLQLHKPPVFIDEVQYAPALFTYIKIHIDQNHTPGDFWLTGSQVFKLMDSVQESLTGRVCLLHMSSLSQAEIYGAVTELFVLDFDKLFLRMWERKAIDTPAIYQRVFDGRRKPWRRASYRTQKPDDC